jgi:hypothetical protein
MSISVPTERYAQDLATQTATSVISPATTIPAGSVCVLLVTSGFGKTVTGVTDSVGNTWRVDVTVSSGTTSSDIAVSIIHAQIATQITSSDTITITYSSASSTHAQIRALTITGLASTGAFDRGLTRTGQGTPTVSVGTTGTLSQADEIIIMCYRLGNSIETSFTPAAGWTNIGGILANNTSCIYQIVSATTPVIPSGTSDTSLVTYVACAAIFGALASTPSVTIKQQGVTWSTWGGPVT